MCLLSRTGSFIIRPRLLSRPRPSVWPAWATQYPCLVLLRWEASAWWSSSSKSCLEKTPWPRHAPTVTPMWVIRRSWDLSGWCTNEHVLDHDHSDDGHGDHGLGVRGPPVRHRPLVLRPHPSVQWQPQGREKHAICDHPILFVRTQIIGARAATRLWEDIKPE